MAGLEGWRWEDGCEKIGVRGIKLVVDRGGWGDRGVVVGVGLVMVVLSECEGRDVRCVMGSVISLLPSRLRGGGRDIRELVSVELVGGR